MRTAHVVTLALACSLAAHADFSYTQTQKATGGMARGMTPDRVTKHYYKGQKMKMDSDTTSTIMDFNAQTMTTINHTQKSYSVMKFSDLAATMKDMGADVQVDLKDTGQRKQISGFNCNQVIMTMAMTMENPQAPNMKMQMQVEMEIWLSSDVPGASEARAFFQKNGEKMFYAMGAGNPQMQKAMGAMQRKLASVGGVPVMQIMRGKMGGGGAPAMSDAQSQQMQQAMAQMEAMKKQGGPQAAAMEQAMARMGAARGAMGGGGSLFEMTMESSAFSASGVPDSVFEIPAGYTKK